MQVHTAYRFLQPLKVAFVCSTLLLSISTSQAFAQGDPAAGVQMFSTNNFGVDLATGNVNVSIPIRLKPTLSVSLVGNFHPYLDPNGFWIVNTGFKSTGNGLLGYAVLWQYTRPYPPGCHGHADNIDYGFYVNDMTGAQHPVSAIQMDELGCVPPTGSGVTSDGSGYTVVTGGSFNISSWKIYDSSGNNLSFRSTTTPDGVILNSGPSPGTSGTYQDPLSSTAVLTASVYTGVSTPDTYSYYDASGTQQMVTVSKTGYYQWTAFGCWYNYQRSSYLPTTITTPTGVYSIGYEQTPGQPSGYVTGRIASITYPSGGSVSYTYSGASNGINCANGSAPLLQVTVSDGKGNNSQYTYTNSDVQGAFSTATAIKTDPAGNQTVYIFGGEFQTLATTYQGGCPTGTTGCNGGGTLLRTVTTCYNGVFTNCGTSSYLPTLPITRTDVYTSFNGSSSNLVETKFDSYGNTTEVKKYDFGAAMPPTGNPVSDTVISYGQSWNGTTCTAYPAGTYIRNTPCYSHTLNSLGTDVAKTQITYSNTGHATSTAKWTSGTAWVTSTATYNTNGTVATAHDTNGTLLTYSYNGTGGCNSLETTGVTIAGTGVSQSRSMTWDCNGAVQTSLTDENGNITYTNFTNGSVADPLYRPVSVVDPLNTTAFSYSPTSIESAMNFNGAVSTADALITTDGLGRTIFGQKRQGQGSSNFDTTQTAYSWNTTGLVTKQSVPYGGTQAQSAPVGTAVTTTQYDALGRPLTVTDGGGGTTTYTYIQKDVLQVIGPAKLFQKQMEYDGLGRLISVCEITLAAGSGSCGQVNSATGFLTKYTYSALGDLLAVTQNAQPGAIGGQQTRGYTYDGLSRLTAETNPEWGPGTANYTYDVACGGTYLASGGDRTKKVDSAGNTTCYGYDGLHRLTDAGNVGPVCRHLRYDHNVTPPSGITVSNTQTQMEEAYTDACTGSKITDEWFSYDADGRMTDVYESTLHSGSAYYHTTASYWANGTLDALSGIPGVPTIYYGGVNGAGLDGEGRATKVGAASGTNPVNLVTYSATTTTTALAGSLTAVTYGSTDKDTFTYDPNTGRQAGYTFKVNGQNDAGTLNWNANGTLATLAISDALPASVDTQTCNYFYDDLGRLGGQDANGYSVDCGATWQQLFTFDPFGNIKKSGTSSFLPTYSATTNRFTISGVTIQYDGSGNLLRDNLNTPYTWDPNFGNSASVNGINLTYDALGRMVEQQNGSAYTQILYSPAGKTALMNGQTLAKAFISLPGGGTAIFNSSGLAYFRHSDWLGSSRLTSTVARSPYSTSAYAPFGELYAVSGASDPSFTGQNSDTASTLYDFMFRENSPSQGRWISPDPAGLAAVDPTNPQTWNRYAYVLNNPLTNVDWLGLWCVWEDGTHDEDPNNDGNATRADCAKQGGHWDPFDTITGIFQDGNGNITQINYAANGQNYTCTSADCGAGGTLEQFDQMLGGYSVVQLTYDEQAIQAIGNVLNNDFPTACTYSISGRVSVAGLGAGVNTTQDGTSASAGPSFTLSKFLRMTLGLSTKGIGAPDPSSGINIGPPAGGVAVNPANGQIGAYAGKQFKLFGFDTGATVKVTVGKIGTNNSCANASAKGH